MKVNGNILCRVTHQSWAEARNYCDLINCDGIVDNGDAVERYEAVKNAPNGQGCRVPSSFAHKLIYTPIQQKDGSIDWYVCPGGRSECVSRSNGRNGNILCATTHENMEEAQYYCEITDCDAIITNNYRWEAVKYASRTSACQRSSQINVQIPYNRHNRRGKRSTGEY